MIIIVFFTMKILTNNINKYVYIKLSKNEIYYLSLEINFIFDKFIIIFIIASKY
jgi:hypothetical protein